MYDSMNAVGAHEILVETPEHHRHWADFEPTQLERVFRAAQQRSVDLRNDSRFRHVVWVRNYGLRGSVFQHPHSHVMASAFVPRAIEEELKGFRDYARWKERCVLCDIVKQEQRDGRRLLGREDHVVAFAPFASGFPYEFWFVPVHHSHDFGGASPRGVRATWRASSRACCGASAGVAGSAVHAGLAFVSARGVRPGRVSLAHRGGPTPAPRVGSGIGYRHSDQPGSTGVGRGTTPGRSRIVRSAAHLSGSLPIRRSAQPARPGPGAGMGDLRG